MTFHYFCSFKQKLTVTDGLRKLNLSSTAQECWLTWLNQLLKLFSQFKQMFQDMSKTTAVSLPTPKN